jgi:hypothetical protein
MAYIGKQPLVGNFIKLDAITASATDTYNLLNDSVAYTPQSAMNCIVSLNGVIQAPITAYTIVGTTIVFSETLSASDTIDFILVLGDVLDVGTVSDDTISTAKIKNLAVTAGKLAATQDLSTKTITLPASVSGLGTGITNAQLAGSIADAKITGLSSSKLSGALPAISGASLTSLNASNIGSGTVPTARLGTGTADSSVFLAGDNTWIAAGGGKIGQVVSTTKTDTATSTSTSLADMTGMTLNITPAATSSKVLVFADIKMMNTDGTACIVSLLRDSTEIYIGDAASPRLRASTYVFGSHNREIWQQGIHFLDSPSSTSELTYKLQWQTESASTMYLNRGQDDSSGAFYPRYASSITAMEVLA